MKPTRPLQRFHPCAWHRAAGFTLVEMAVVVTLMAIVLTMGLRLLSATRDSAAWSETKVKQERIKGALLAYLRTNGRLPCPNSVAPWDGAEDTPLVAPVGPPFGPGKPILLGPLPGDPSQTWTALFHD